MKKTFRVVESSVSSDGKVTTKTFKGNLSETKARDLADKLNMAQDLPSEDGAPMLSYRAEISKETANGGQPGYVQ